MKTALRATFGFFVSSASASSTREGTFWAICAADIVAGLKTLAWCSPLSRTMPLSMANWCPRPSAATAALYSWSPNRSRRSGEVTLGFVRSPVNGSILNFARGSADRMISFT
jgi:hypothetical protein